MGWHLSSLGLAQPVQWNALLLFGSLLLCGLVGGHIVRKTRWMPRITGYLLAGALLGAGGFNLLSGEILKLADIFADIAVALIVYQLGRYVDVGWLRREKWLAVSVAAGAALCFVLVWSVLRSMGMASPLAILAGVLAIGTAPAIVMVIVREQNAEGPIVRRLAAMTALNNLVALLAAYLLLPLVATEGRTPFYTMASHALYSLCGSLFLAYLTYRLMLPLARWVGRERARQFVLVIAVITLLIGAAHAFQLPVLLTMLAFAILSKNLDAQYDLMELEFGAASELFIVVLFVTIGATLQMPSVTQLALTAAFVAAMLAARSLAMACSLFAFARPARLKWKQAGWLTLASLPVTEAGLGLIQVSHLYPHTIADIAPLLAGVLILSELLGPILTQFALIRSGESAQS